MTTLPVVHATENAEIAADPSWRDLYRAGAVSVPAFIVLTLASIVSAAITNLPSAGRSQMP